MTFTVEHKACGAIRVIEGETLYQAMKKNGLDLNKWVEKK